MVMVAVALAARCLIRQITVPPMGSVSVSVSVRRMQLPRVVDTGVGQRQVRARTKADQEPVRRRPGGHAERRTQRIALRSMQPADPVQERHQHPVQRGEAEPQL
jgi:hypothetical protein